jgi:hypothetical protein
MAPDVGDGQVAEQSHGEDWPGDRGDCEAAVARGLAANVLEDEGEALLWDQLVQSLEERQGAIVGKE